MFEDQQPRIPTHVWVEAQVRAVADKGMGVYVSARGDRMGGLVLQKISDMAGQCRLLAQQRDLLGKMVWINALQDDVVEEREADAYIARARQRDPDLWVIEIEDRTMAESLPGP